tara:strand:- start:463 stop:783 length:321 start_codon:yes stop_codon:yes gene_type:complete
MPDKKKNVVAKAIDKYKSKRNKKKIAKIQNSGPKDKLDAQGNIIFNNGGRVKKKKEPLKNKVKRKVSQFKNRKVEKLYKRTHNTDLFDKGNPKDKGYSSGGFIQHD